VPEDGLVKGLAKELVKELSESQIKILNLIERLKKIVERKGGRRAGYWRIIEHKK
jgi:hypothetical protein